MHSRNATREKSQSRAAPAPSAAGRYSYPSPADGDRELGESECEFALPELKRAPLTEPESPSPLDAKPFAYPERRRSAQSDAHRGLLAPDPAPAPASAPETPLPVFSPNRLVSSGTVVAGTVAVPARLTARALAAHDRRTSAVHPFLHDFTSPIGERPRTVRPRVRR